MESSYNKKFEEAYFAGMQNFNLNVRPNGHELSYAIGFAVGVTNGDPSKITWLDNVSFNAGITDGRRTLTIN